jgi:hypothetical protein
MRKKINDMVMTLNYDEIKEIAEKFKTNGGSKISNTDMNWYLIHRIDDLGAKFDCMMTKDDCLNFRTGLETQAKNKTTWLISIGALSVSFLAIIATVIVNMG